MMENDGLIWNLWAFFCFVWIQFWMYFMVFRAGLGIGSMLTHGVAKQLRDFWENGVQ